MSHIGETLHQDIKVTYGYPDDAYPSWTSPSGSDVINFVFLKSKCNYNHNKGYIIGITGKVFKQ